MSLYNSLALMVIFGAVIYQRYTGVITNQNVITFFGIMAIYFSTLAILKRLSPKLHNIVDIGLGILAWAYLIYKSYLEGSLLVTGSWFLGGICLGFVLVGIDEMLDRKYNNK